MNRLFALFAVLSTVGVSSARGQDIVNELFGHGVHAFYSGQLDTAIELFNQAVDAGSQDPRVYYFRGLAQTRQAGAGSGLADYQTGAELEASARRSVSSDVISKSLIRIQGAQRLEIEKVRYQARLAASIQNKLLQRANGASSGPTMQPAPPVDPSSVSGGLMQGQPQEMPSQETPPPAVGEVAPPVPTNPAAPSDPASDPFKDDPVTPPASDAPTTPPASDDPFGGGANPFGN